MRIFIALTLCLTFAVIWLWVIPTYAAPLEPGNYYFKATWCAPCKEQSKIVAKLQKQGYEFTIYDSDVDPEAFEEMKVTSIPTIVVVKDDGTVLELKGPQPIKKLVKLLKNGKLLEPVKKVLEPIRKLFKAMFE